MKEKKKILNKFKKEYKIMQHELREELKNDLLKSNNNLKITAI